MPPFLDRVQLDHALHDQVLPVLEALAANDNLRNRTLTRFERDDPPPYAESTESEEWDDAPPPPPPRHGKLPEELQLIMDQPIRTGELDRYCLESSLEPGDVYYSDARLEESRLSRSRTRYMFREREGAQRLGILVRHNVKRRWEQLGVWNPEWGFPGREVQLNDNVAGWKWPWQQHEADGPGPNNPYTHKNPYTQQLLARALHLRQNLSRGESSPTIPRSHLKEDASASEAESFIISRPWFIFEVEVAEERARYFRLSNEHRRLYPYSARAQVIEWWKERGDWREEFNETKWVTSWKWRHESSSPEPEPEPEPEHEPQLVHPDPRHRMKLTLVHNAADMKNIEFTPSEIGDLETTRLPYDEQPPGFWTIEDGYPGRRNFPGQTLDLVPSAREACLNISKLPPVPHAFRLFPDPPPPGEDRETPPELPRPQQGTMSPPPQNSQGSDQHIPQAKPKVQNEGTHPPPRRSARIASLKRPAEPLPSETAPNKKLRVRAAPKAAAPVTQRTTRETRRTRAGPVQSLLSRKESRGPSKGKKTRRSKPSAVTKSPADSGQPKARISRAGRAGRKDAEAPAVIPRLRVREKRDTK